MKKKILAIIIFFIALVTVCIITFNKNFINPNSKEIVFVDYYHLEKIGKNYLLSIYDDSSVLIKVSIDDLYKDKKYKYKLSDEELEKVKEVFNVLEKDMIKENYIYYFDKDELDKKNEINFYVDYELERVLNAMIDIGNNNKFDAEVTFNSILLNKVNND